MKEMTKENLKASLAGESQAYVKYQAFAGQADKEAMPNIARLFRAIARAEQVHATNHLRELGSIGKTAANLDSAIAGENFEVDEMYAAYLEVADAQGEQGAHRSMTYAIEAEKLHAVLYGQAKSAVTAGQDLVISHLYVCPVCGWTHIGEPPDRCPICNTRKDRFEVF